MQTEEELGGWKFSLKLLWFVSERSEAPAWVQLQARTAKLPSAVFISRKGGCEGFVFKLVHF